MAVAARKPLFSAPAHGVEYRHILVPLGDEGGLERAMTTACKLAAERGATVTAISVIEVPAELPLDAHMLEEEAQAKRLLSLAEAIGDLHGVSVATVLTRARGAGPAILEEAARARAEIIVLRASAREGPRSHGPFFGSTASFVLQNAACRVIATRPAPV